MGDLTAMLADLRSRVSTLERSRTLPRDGDGRVLLPGGAAIGPPSDRVVVARQRLDPPAGPSVAPGAFADRIFADVSWPAVDGAVAYEVVLRDVDAGTIVVQSPTGTSVRFDRLQPITTYAATVAAVDGLGRASDPSDETTFDSGQDTTDPSQVESVIVTAGLRTIVVRWDDVADEDVRNGRGWYEIHVGVEDTFADPVAIARVSATITSFADLAANTIYHVRVRAIDTSANVGPWSDTVSASTPPAGEGRDFLTDPITAAELAVTVGGGNWLANSSFEDDLSGWLIGEGGEHATVEMVAAGRYGSYTEGYE